MAVAGPPRLARTARLAAAGALALAACSDSTVSLAPVIDLPSGDSDATAAPLDSITLSVAHAGGADLVSHMFQNGQPLELPGAPFGNDLVVHMTGFVGQSTVGYGRTCMLKIAPGATPPAPHLFFSRITQFATIDAMPAARIGGLGVAYQGGALLVGGAASDMTSVAEVERFDPATGKLSSVAPVMPRTHPVGALLGSSPSRVVVLGGSVTGGASGMDGARFIEVVDAQSVERQDNGDMARVDLTATSLTDGRVVVIGGSPPSGGAPVGAIEIVTQLANLSLDVRTIGATLAIPRSRHTATQLGDDVGAVVLIAGGLDATGMPVATAELFKPLSEELSNPTLDPKGFHAQMIVPRSEHTAMLMPDGSVLIIGGFDALNQPVATLELFSVDGGFVAAGALPAGAGLVDFTATALPDGRILITGGREVRDGPAVTTAYIARLNSIIGAVDVVATDHLAVARAGHQAVVLCDGTVLISGGTTVPLPAERYNPPPDGRR